MRYLIERLNAITDADMGIVEEAAAALEAQAKRIAELEKASVALADESQRLQNALEFYAARNHFIPDLESEWDDVSGEPPNFLCGHGEATVEDGSVARKALEGFDWRMEKCDDCGHPLGHHVARIECPRLAEQQSPALPGGHHGS